MIIKRLWKIYAWFFAFLAIAGNICLVFGYPSRTSFATVSLVNVFQTVITLLGLIPLFLFSYRKRFLNAAFWKIFFFVFMFFELKDTNWILSGSKSGFYPFAGLIFTSPSYFAIFFYAFYFWKHSVEGGAVEVSSKNGNDFVCIYTANNEHDAQLVKIGLEGGGIEVVLQRKSYVSAPNSFLHKLELFVREKDKDKSVKLLSGFKRKSI